jgi:hypothetical protein
MAYVPHHTKTYLTPLIKNRNLEHQSPQMVQRPKLNEATVGRFDEGYDSDGQIGPFMIQL